VSPLPADLAEALTSLAGRRPLLLASDYDGVLAPLVDEPSAATPLPGVGDVLALLAATPGVTVALVSGRGLEDLRTTSGFRGSFRWIGSHGAEFDAPLGADLADLRDALVEQLAAVVAGTPGARLEIKPASVAVHVRQVADRDAGRALLEYVASIVDASLTKKPGKDVLELAVTDADKGAALHRLRAELGPAGALYLGDDRTDEDGFRALEPGDVTVKIGDGETAARYRVPDPAGALAVLEHLAGLLR
jgi:trehalose 6-phosphate phosphatase